MDFSKLRKIFYIVCIISMLLSIKSKVFGLTFNYNNVIYDNNTFTTSQYPYFMVCLNTNKTFYHIVQSDEPISYVMDMSDKYLRTTGIDSSNNCYYYSMPIESFNEYDFSNYNYGTLETSDFQFRFTNSNENYIYSNYDVYVDGSSVHSANDSQYLQTNPFFDNVTEIQNSNFKQLYIDLGDYSKTDNLYFHLLTVDNIQPISSTESNYYYTDKIFILNNKSKYIKQLFDTGVFYYSIPRSALSLNPDTSYVYVLNNSSEQITNSLNVITKDNNFDVVLSDTTGVITADMSMNDKMQNINEELGIIQDDQNNFYNQNTINEDTQTDIDTNINFDNSAPNFSNLYGSFFSRLSTTISNLGNYDLSNIETINLPIPFTQNTIPISSNMVSEHMPTFLSSLFTTFWLFIFGKYFLAYILYIYRLIASGHILDNISSNNETITNDVL